MQKSETRRFLEEQFDKYERSRPEQTAPFVSESTEEEAPADEFLLEENASPAVLLPAGQKLWQGVGRDVYDSSPGNAPLSALSGT